MDLPKPLAFDPQMLEILKATGMLTPSVLSRENFQARRNLTASMLAPENIFTDPEIVHEEATTMGVDGNTVELTVIQRKNPGTGLRPGIYHIHGGGMFLGTRTLGVNSGFPLIKELDAVFVSVEYRLAPENIHPALVEDCYSGLKWMSDNMSKLGIDPNRVMIMGGSAGGGLAAGTALMARDRNLSLKLRAQLLVYPMLDDRGPTISAKQFMSTGAWTGASNAVAWDWVFGGKNRDVKDIQYQAPGRATDLSDLPSTWIDCGSAEPFREEVVAYANKLWEHGVPTELHVWSGSFHGGDIFAPNADLVKAWNLARLNWIRRAMGVESEKGNVAVAFPLENFR